ncbi:hypothetical protein FB446DRAFT_485939 [Lentinula raphanica]|nr:hypothetical protein FB446DRAFT_485939 [Lentinula raphanica]
MLSSLPRDLRITNMLGSSIIEHPVTIHSTSMKLIGVFRFSVLATTALGSIIPRDPNTVLTDFQNAAELCVSLKSTVDQIKPQANDTILGELVTGANKLANAYKVAANDAKASTTMTDNQALTIITLVDDSIENCVIPTLNEMTADSSILFDFRAVIEAILKELDADYVACAVNLLELIPVRMIFVVVTSFLKPLTFEMQAAEQSQATTVAEKPQTALQNCLKAYS